MKITISKENYLKAIAEASSEGVQVIPATLARWLNVSAPAVTMALRRLKRDDLIEMAPEGQVTLTAEGQAIASRLLHRHHLIERMLSEIFGMEWYKVHDEAEQLEHAVSEDFEQKLVEKLGSEQACPHGSRFGLESAAERRGRGWLPLDELTDPGAARVACVFERDRKLLEFLDGLGLRPGAQIQFVERNYDETLTLNVAGKPVKIGQQAAGKVWVEPVPVPALWESR